ncbi:2Fe-2S iron-sulfur cluster binding domain-containing protein [Streptomyces sp. SID8379]|uniref:PDR/VanB family oxidoreductase n=1 Tax=unclassified Streptomyces TaxID=2593676 RepID=UPI00036578C8|nr:MULTISPECIES: PDR/VanB family oxidoreductase [unclassified Streptomyces]MYW65219.1 2Fe-2S iron-sulfur cluster binding domain-containing protein [Streptomyces sp. SID8379]
MTDSDRQLELLVRRMTWEAEGVLSVELAHADGKPLPAWEPGAHIDVHVGGQIRQYSLCGDPAATCAYRIGVLNEPSSRGGSRHVHTALRPGQTVTVSEPRNHFALEPAEGYVFVAGGIGVTPILAMAREAARRGAWWRLVYGGRTRSSMAFTDELAALGGDVTLVPQDELGHIDLAAALSELSDPPESDTLVYCCGPEPLLAAVEAQCPSDVLRVERFAAPVVERGADDGEFEVECRSSGLRLTVGPDTSILEAAERAGLDVASSCRDGICGSCETRVLDGAPDHRDFLLSEAEHAANASMMICVSRCAAGSRLVLDL